MHARFLRPRPLLGRGERSSRMRVGNRREAESRRLRHRPGFDFDVNSAHRSNYGKIAGFLKGYLRGMTSVTQSFDHLKNPYFTVARPLGLEPRTLCLEGRCSIQLSYGRTWKSVTCRSGLTVI